VLRTSVFHGTADETRALIAAIERNCTRTPAGPCSGHCAAHAAMLSQCFLDGVLFARHLAPQLLFEEFDACPVGRCSDLQRAP
jgi:hypothetical protein